MTEKEKMQCGQLYAADTDPELIADRAACKDKCWAYNQMRYTDWDGRNALLRELLGSTGERFCIEQPFWCDYGYGISIGENFYMNHGCVILDGGGVTFGDNVFIAPQCGFHTAGHPIDTEARNSGLEYARPIRVGNNVWIGAGVTVVPGVTIGDNVVIGAGSLVNHDSPSGVVAGGNPCRVIRPITEEDKKKPV